MIKLTLVLMILFSSISLSSRQSIDYYDIKVFKGDWNFYSGTKECKFIYNKDLSVIEFGGTGKRDYRIELRRVSND